MKKQFFDLQLFAEDTAADTTAATAEPGKATDDKGPETVAEPEKKYTDADLDRIIKGKKAEWQKGLEKEVNAAKEAEKEAARLEKMNAQQKAEYERDKLQKELDEYKRKDTIAEMTKTARKMLSDEGITISDDLLSMLVSTEAEKTKAAVDGFSKAYKEAVESAVKERLKGEPPRKGSGGTVTMTKEQIMAIKDPELRQKKMLENRSLFNI